MTRRKRLITGIKKAALGWFFALLALGGWIGVLGGAGMLRTEDAYAVPSDGASGQRTDENGNNVEDEETGEGEATENGENAEGTDGQDNGGGNGQNGGGDGQNGEQSEGEAAGDGEQEEKKSTGDCKDSLGAIGWLVCPVTGKLAEAVDWLYDRIEGILVINPVKIEDGSPIYEVWKYCLGLTNIVFVIFFLIVIYSQLTGFGLTNYGIKRSLPKLIVTAIMVNLSFLICSVAVDVSNVVGAGLRGVFQSIEETVTQGSEMNMHLGLGGILGALGGAGLAVGAGVIAFESGAIWLLIPVVLGAIVAVVVGLVTIAMRQAVVALLIMISPLAMVCCILPNTEQWYNRWKNLLMQMLIFYPMFSLLFGASALAGTAIIYSAKDGFNLILGVAVQTLPLFFSWSLMKMSGTVLGTVSSRLQAMTTGTQARVRSMAEQQRQLSRAKHLASERTYMPSMKLMQYLSNRQIARTEELSQHQQTIRNRGLAYRAQRNYRRDGAPSRRGERTYAEMAQNLDYQRSVLRDQNNMNRGLADLVPEAATVAAEGGAEAGAEAGATGAKENMSAREARQARRRVTQRARLAALDERMINASDYLRAEQTRGDKIEYENALGFHQRMTQAINAHVDDANGYERTVDEDGNTVVTPRAGYRLHSNVESADLARYNAINKIMDGDAANTYLVAASAAQSYDTQRKIIETKMDKYFDLTEATKDVELRLSELTQSEHATENIDSIIAGLRVLNKRGDTDIVRAQVQNVLDQGVELGTHAAQALGNFLMFEVKDESPSLRRFGKYINLETAAVFSANKRSNTTVTLDEMVRGEYEDVNPETGEVVIKRSKMGLPELMQGTSLNGIERTAMNDIDDMLKHAYVDAGGELDVQKYLARRQEVQTAMAPAFISASLNFLSGSEQMKALVSFLTGYDKNGKARWEPGGDLASNAEEAEKYFRQQTIQYINAQTPNQLLGLRSDYYKPLMEHLSREYEEEEMEGWSEEEKEAHAEMVAEMAEIQTRYGDLPAEEAQRRREADMQALKNKMAGTEFRQLLDSRGKLEQIYRTRPSGAANNAKDWVREWLGLDDEAAVKEWLHNRYEEQRRDQQSEQKERQERRERRERREREEMPSPDTAGEEAEEEYGGFTEADREDFANRLQAEYDDWVYMDGEDVDAFYETSREFVQENLQDVGELILRRYDDYRTTRPRASAKELLEELQQLLRDRENY